MAVRRLIPATLVTAFILAMATPVLASHGSITSTLDLKGAANAGGTQFVWTGVATATLLDAELAGEIQIIQHSVELGRVSPCGAIALYHEGELHEFKFSTLLEGIVAGNGEGTGKKSVTNGPVGVSLASTAFDWMGFEFSHDRAPTYSWSPKGGGVTGTVEGANVTIEGIPPGEYSFEGTALVTSLSELLPLVSQGWLSEEQLADAQTRLLQGVLDIHFEASAQGNWLVSKETRVDCGDDDDDP